MEVWPNVVSLKIFIFYHSHVMLVQCDIVSTNEQVAPLVMIPESLIHSDLDKVRRLGGISCYFSENYFSGCLLAHWELKFWPAKGVVCSIQVSEFLFCFQLSSVSSTDAIFFSLQNILAQFHVFSSQIFPFWTLMEKNSHFSISVLFFWPQNSAKINYATNFAIAKNLTLAKILYWGLSVIKIITRIVSSNCICEFFKRQLMLLALLHCI